HNRPVGVQHALDPAAGENQHAAAATRNEEPTVRRVFGDRYRPADADDIAQARRVERLAQDALDTGVRLDARRFDGEPQAGLRVDVELSQRALGEFVRV